jgi:hypothetical protein
MNFDELLKNLQLEYVAALPNKIAIIKSQIKAGDLKALRESFHKFKGTGRTYGLPEISELSELVERLCMDEHSGAVVAATHAVALLADIHKARTAKQQYSMHHDPRYLEIRNLLHK